MIAPQLPTVHFSDEYCQEIRSATKLTVNDILQASRALPTPKWFNALFWIRDVLVGSFGIKTLRNHTPDNTERFGIFSVLEKNEHRIIAGENDKHLDFRVAITLSESNNRQSISFQTLVHFNNIFGRLYFVPVKPFHKIIVPILLRRMVRNFEQHKTA